MKSVNPLHIIVLLFVVLVFLLLQLSQAKEGLVESKAVYKETLTLATQLKLLDKAYGDKKSVRKSIGIVLKQHSLKSTNIVQSIGKSSMIISSQSMDKVALNSLMSKILNGSYNVRSMKIKRLSDTNVNFSMEIQW